MQATKHDTNKVRFDLLPPVPLEQLAAVFTYGASQYGERNWEEGMKWSRLFSATQRHLWAYWRGEDIDRESGLPHLAHATASLLMLMEYSEIHQNFDDRPKQ